MTVLLAAAYKTKQTKIILLHQIRLLFNLQRLFAISNYYNGAFIKEHISSFEQQYTVKTTGSSQQLILRGKWPILNSVLLLWYLSQENHIYILLTKMSSSYTPFSKEHQIKVVDQAPFCEGSHCSNQILITHSFLQLQGPHGNICFKLCSLKYRGLSML